MDCHTQTRETVAGALLFSSGGEMKVIPRSGRARAYGPEENSSKIRFLFDSCSTSFFVRAKALNLPFVGTISLIINAFR